MRIMIVIGQEGSKTASKELRVRFFLEANNLMGKLTSELNIPEKSISFISLGGYLETTAEDIRKSLETAILEDPKEDFCLIYIGHGQENGWAISGIRDEQSLSYEALNLVFAPHEGNLIFLNSCCYGGAAEESLAAHPDNSLLISPLPATHFGYVFSFFNTLVENWKNGQFFDPETSGDNTDSKPVVIGNPELQKLFFLPQHQHNKGGSCV